VISFAKSKYILASDSDREAWKPLPDSYQSDKRPPVLIEERQQVYYERWKNWVDRKEEAQIAKRKSEELKMDLGGKSTGSRSKK